MSTAFQDAWVRIPQNRRLLIILTALVCKQPPTGPFRFITLTECEIEAAIANTGCRQDFADNGDLILSLTNRYSQSLLIGATNDIKERQCQETTEKGTTAITRFLESLEEEQDHHPSVVSTADDALMAAREAASRGTVARESAAVRARQPLPVPLAPPPKS